jgi:hypothetical protein
MDTQAVLAAQPLAAVTGITSVQAALSCTLEAPEHNAQVPTHAHCFASLAAMAPRVGCVSRVVSEEAGLHSYQAYEHTATRTSGL